MVRRVWDREEGYNYRRSGGTVKNNHDNVNMMLIIALDFDRDGSDSKHCEI